MRLSDVLRLRKEFEANDKVSQENMIHVKD